MSDGWLIVMLLFILLVFILAMRIAYIEAYYCKKLENAGIKSSIKRWF